MIRRLNENNQMENRTFKEVAEICQKYGYILNKNSCIRTNSYGKTLMHILIDPDLYTNEYLPEIYVDIDRSTPDHVVFNMNTESFGVLTVKEYKKFYKAIQSGMGLLTTLSGMDLSGFPRKIE